MTDDPDADVRAAVVRGLAARGPTAIPALRRRLADADDDRRAAACHLAGMIGPPARDALPDLRRATREDPAAEVRKRAAWALTQVAPDDPGTVAELLRLLASADAADREGAAFALRMLGAAARDAIPALIDAVGDADAEVREESVKALNAVAGTLAEADGPLRARARAAAARAIESLSRREPPGPSAPPR